jgi:uncharacterized protein DUF4157
MHEYERDTQSETRSTPSGPAGPDAAGILALQRLAGNGAVASMLAPAQRSPVLDVVGSGGGRPLEAPVRTAMEEHLGADLSSVRVHTDGAADASARSVGAEAYTVGDDVVFASGRYAPDSDSGQRMLAHELTHVVQQRSGPVDGTPVDGGVAVSDPGDRFEQEADRSAESFGI